MNPAVSDDCTENFWLKSAYCVAVDESGAETSTKSAVSSKIGTSSQFTTASVESTTPVPTRATTKITSSKIVSSISQTASQNATRSATTTYFVLHPISTWNITVPTIDKTWPPKATQAGQPSNCNKWHLVRGGQTCRSVLNKYSSFMREKEFFEWNPEVHKDCTGLFVGYWVCVGVRSNTTLDLDWGSSAPPFTPPPEPTKHTRTTLTQTEPDFEPTPSQGPMPKNCLNFYKAEANETCDDILDTYSYISKEQFFKYNPALKENCNGLWEGNWYCVGVEDELPPLLTVTATPSSIPRGSPKDCRSWYYTTGGETCELLAKVFGTFSEKEFIAMNPTVMKDCDEIEDNRWYCIAIPDTPTTRTAERATPTSRITSMPTQTGMSSDCNKHWLVSKKDTCKSVEKANGITHERFVAWNKAIGNGCAGLKPDSYVCVGVKST